MLSQSGSLEFLIVQSISYSKLYFTFWAWLNYNNAGRHKIKWGKISKNENESCYTVPIDFELSTLSMSD